jgi:hypothetical protein
MAAMAPNNSVRTFPAGIPRPVSASVIAVIKAAGPQM